MTGFEFLKQYWELYEEEIELAQIKHNAFDVFDSCATELSPSVLSIERYYSQVKADKEYTESIIEEKLRTFIEGIDTNAIIRNILYLSVPYLKDFLIGFLTLDKDA